MEKKCERLNIRFTTKDFNKIKMYAKIHSEGDITKYLTDQALYAPVIKSTLNKKPASKKKRVVMIDKKLTAVTLSYFPTRYLKGTRNGTRKPRLARNRKDT